MAISHGFPVSRMLLSQFGTAFDVGKEEGNGAAWQVFHQVSIQLERDRFKDVIPRVALVEDSIESTRWNLAHACLREPQNL